MAGSEYLLLQELGVCVDCPAGRFGTGLSCVDCQPGFFANESLSSACVSCPPGRFASSALAENCSEWSDDSCDAGQAFVPGTNTSDTFCDKCGVGRFQPIANSTVTDCTDWTSCGDGAYRVPGTRRACMHPPARASARRSRPATKHSADQRRNHSHEVAPFIMLPRQCSDRLTIAL